ncbi:MAG: D-2-hydroxyacid dehydrogenase [Planctomycetaceae bacterium]|jgi:phosphoglycerate dehydrogenase-like enzyme|nr:D-2-hydroxyacid dehydrogenase [Planctomycetaceae bacterium]MCE2812141.1 D-2-hydroxyacid dehydrogenase [Planctomycetaceae bacterium]
MKQLVVCYPVEERHLQAIQQAAPDYQLIVADQQTIPDLIHQADVFVGHAKVPVDWDRVAKSGRLKFIQSSAAGLDHCLAPSIIESPVVVCSASGLFADQVAEQTLALLLGLLRGIPIFYRQQQKHEFVRRPTADLHRKRIGIVGLGGNGRRLAQILEPFRVSIRATDYFPEHKPPQVEELLPHTQLLSLAAWSEILILTLPLNASTLGIIDRKVFSAMPKGSFLINVARGQCVNEQDLIDALESGRLAGAGLDVTAVEPLPAESRLYDQPNVLITPHVGAQSGPRYDDSTRLICENLKRYLAGQTLFNIVDKKLGFPHPSVLYLPD